MADIAPGTVIHLPSHSGDGYGWGGGVVVSIGGLAPPIGEHYPQGLPQLLAASPDLLAALEEILDYTGGADTALNDDFVVDRARAAITKAKN